MDSKTYITNAIKTESVPAELQINQIGLHACLSLAIATSNLLNLVKRKLYYDKAFDKDEVLKELSMIYALSQYVGGAIEAGADDDLGTPVTQEYLETQELPDYAKNIKLSNINPRLLHCALGCFTESGELIEAIQKQYETGAMDLVNFGEEIGDIEWYQAIGFDETGVSEESCREKNIAKLKKRYPGKFCSASALNRDLIGERSILEGNESVHSSASERNQAHLDTSISEIKGKIKDRKNKKAV